MTAPKRNRISAAAAAPKRADNETLAPAAAQRIARALEQWYAKHRRDLPWRRRAQNRQDRAYRTLIAEYMLHQTQVVRVLEYYERFLEAFGDVAALAQASEQQVLALWQGLGYYRRARHLHQAAKMICDDHGGRIPGDVDALLALPGVGRYTAGAVASIAFGRRAPIVDGNVQRVIARWFEIGGGERPANAEVWRCADRLVKSCSEPGAFNQALMELGSTVCLPRQPCCDGCPAARWCRARINETVEQFPSARRRARTPVIHSACLVAHRGGRILLAQRPATGLWAGLWQCPTLEGEARATWEQLAAFVKSRHGLAAANPGYAGAFAHQTSHRRILFDIWIAGRAAGRARRARWVRREDLAQFPLSNAQKRALALAPRPTGAGAYTAAAREQRHRAS